jgi:hypothetical protein
MKRVKNLTWLLCIIMAIVAIFGLASCSKGNEKTTLTGHYYTEVVADADSGSKRGCELFVILNADQSIYTIALDDESSYTCADSQVLWSIKSSGYFNNLATLGISGVNQLKVNCGDDGLPTEIEGMDTDWLVPMNTTACGMVVLALQNAFSGM